MPSKPTESKREQTIVLRSWDAVAITKINDYIRYNTVYHATPRYQRPIEAIQTFGTELIDAIQSDPHGDINHLLEMLLKGHEGRISVTLPEDVLLDYVEALLVLNCPTEAFQEMLFEAKMRWFDDDLEDLFDSD